MFDLFLQANTDQRLTSSTDRLAALEHRYERLHVVTVALGGLLKEHTGLTDSDLECGAAITGGDAFEGT